MKLLFALCLLAVLGWYVRSVSTAPPQAAQQELRHLFGQNHLINNQQNFGDLQDVVKKMDQSDLNRILYRAAESGLSLDALKWIVDRGAMPRQVPALDDLTFFGQLVRVPRLETIEYFLAQGLNPLERARDGRSIVHVAAQGGLDRQILALLLAHGLKLTDQYELGRMPIHCANVVSIPVLVAAGAEIDAKDTLGRTALMLAEKDGRNEVAVELLRNKASVFARDDRGRTPLHYAAMSNNAGQLVDTLLDAGAQVTVRDDDGYTAKELAIRSRDVRKVQTRGWFDKL